MLLILEQNRSQVFVLVAVFSLRNRSISVMYLKLGTFLALALLPALEGMTIWGLHLEIFASKWRSRSKSTLWMCVLNHLLLDSIRTLTRIHKNNYYYSRTRIQSISSTYFARHKGTVYKLLQANDQTNFLTNITNRPIKPFHKWWRGMWCGTWRGKSVIAS